MQLRNFVFMPVNSACSSFSQVCIEKSSREWLYAQGILQLVVLLALQYKIPLKIVLSGGLILLLSLCKEAVLFAVKSNVSYVSLHQKCNC